MFIYALIVGKKPEHNTPIFTLDVNLKQQVHQTAAATCIVC